MMIPPLSPVAVAHVGHTVTVDQKMSETLWQNANMAGVKDWDDFLAILDGQSNAAARMAVHAQLVTMAKDWTPEQWRSAAETFA